jgi:hypothetical protein
MKLELIIEKKIINSLINPINGGKDIFIIQKINHHKPNTGKINITLLNIK